MGSRRKQSVKQRSKALLNNLPLVDPSQYGEGVARVVERVVAIRGKWDNMVKGKA